MGGRLGALGGSARLDAVYISLRTVLASIETGIYASGQCMTRIEGNLIRICMKCDMLNLDVTMTARLLL